MGLTALLNIVVIVILYKPVLKLIKDYDKQLKTGKTPVLNYKEYSEYNLDKEVWEEVYNTNKEDLAKEAK